MHPEYAGLLLARYRALGMLLKMLPRMFNDPTVFQRSHTVCLRS